MSIGSPMTTADLVSIVAAILYANSPDSGDGKDVQMRAAIEDAETLCTLVDDRYPKEDE